MTSLLPFSLAIMLTVVLIIFLFRRAREPYAKSPPGPMGIPILGNILDLVKDPYLIPTFNSWAAKYGPVVQFSVLGQTHVVVSTSKIVHDLFGVRGDIYSDRGGSAAVRYVSGGISPAMSDKNDIWKGQRKLMHSVISSSENVKFEPFIDMESKYTLLDLIENPAFFDDHLARYTHGLVTRAGLAKRTTTMQDPYIREIHQQINFAVNCFRLDKYLSNLAPWLLRAPSLICSDEKVLLAARHRLFRFIQNDQDNLRSRMREGPVPDCTQKFFLEHQHEYGLSDLEGGAVFQAFMSAGTRSPHNALLGFTINILQHPEWLAKLQQHVDENVGPTRLPQFTDIPKLPLVRAVVKEAVRYRTVHAELGIPHKLRRDDIYEGYFFPAGTIFHANTRKVAILSDPEMYPDGRTFNPDRWVNPAFPTFKEPLTTYPNLQNFGAFGVGRRACPAADFAERTLTLMVARIAWLCNINKAVDPNTGETLPLQIEYEPVANPRPLPFPAIFTARSAEKRRIMMEEVTRLRETDPLP